MKRTVAAENDLIRLSDKKLLVIQLSVHTFSQMDFAFDRMRFHAMERLRYNANLCHF